MLIGLVLVNVIMPGAGLSTTGLKAPEGVDAASGNLYYIFKTLIPDNPIQALASGKILSIIFVALLFGAVLTTLGRKVATVVDFFTGLNAAMLKLTEWIMYTAPLGVFGLTAGLFAQFGFGAFGTIIKYFCTVTAGLAIHGLVVLPVILYLVTRVSPWRYALGMMPSLLTAFSTSSSSATLPLTMECAEENNGISNRVASFVLPLGATINMDGTALYEAVAAMTIAQAYGLHMGFGHQITIFLDRDAGGRRRGGHPVRRARHDGHRAQGGRAAV